MDHLGLFLNIFDDPRLDRMGPAAIEATAGLCRILDAARDIAE